MRILRNYILVELLASFLLSLAIFTFVLVMGNMIKLAELVITKGVELIYVGKLFGYMIPYLLSYSVPMSVLTATLLTFGRLSADNEFTAMKASGISLFRIGLPVIVVGLVFSLGCLILNTRVLPKAHFGSRKVLTEIGMKKPTAYIEAGTFIKSFQDYIIFIYGVEKNKLKNIRIYQPRENGPTKTVIARRGEFIPLPEKNAVKLKLIDGSSDEPDPTNPDRLFKLNFKTYELILQVKGVPEEVAKKPKDMTLDELIKEIEILKAESIEIGPLITEIHKKISLSFSALAFVLIGLPLAITTRRGERSVGFGLSLGIIIIYYILLVAGEAFSLKGTCHPGVAMWFPNGLLMLAGGILTWRVVEK